MRDTFKYFLKIGNRIVYIGITNNPIIREYQHRLKKHFGKMEIVGIASTRNGAELWESERLNTYRINHNGNLPLYNKTITGK